MSEQRKMSREDAIARFRDGRPALDSEPKNDFEAEMRARSIGLVTVGLTKADHQYSYDLFDAIIANDPDFLRWSRGNFNKDGVPEDGHVRKELHYNEDGQQKSDPKHIFQLNDSLVARYRAADSSKFSGEAVDFMNTLIEFRHTVGRVGYQAFVLLGESYSGLDEFAYPDGVASLTYRMARYDGHRPGSPDYFRAKEHEDRGLGTVQVNETGPGLWMKPAGLRGDDYTPIAVPHDDGYSRFFLGTTMDIVYGEGEHPLAPLTHGVFGPQPGDEARFSSITFIDPRLYDMSITSLETQRHRTDKQNLNV